jgi:hypothetical protein
MRRTLAAALALATTLVHAGAIAPFSTAAPGEQLPSGWSPRFVPGVAPSQLALVREGDATVLRVRSQASGGAASHALDAEVARTPLLAWRWKVDRVVQGADLARREGDDFAARVYVFFAVPEEALGFGARLKLRLARLLHGEVLPTAGLCYVWDNRHPPGTTAWNPYTDRIRTVVVESGAGRAGQWVEVRRDLEADFRAAFGGRGEVPAISGLAAGNDTDQTGERASAWFGDFRLLARP